MRTHPFAARACAVLVCAALAPAPCGAHRAKDVGGQGPTFSSEAAARVIAGCAHDSGSVRFWHKEAAEVVPISPAVRLSTVPDTGTTWVMYLFEAATGIAAQIPNFGMEGSPGSGNVDVGTMTLCRCQCGARNPWECPELAEEFGIRLADGNEPELFKTHFPVTNLGPDAGFFDTRPSIGKTVLLVRNPIDGFLATQRHASLDDDSKVGGKLKLRASEGEEPPLVELCDEEGFAPLRGGTEGYGEDVLSPEDYNYLLQMGNIGSFDVYMAQWAFFVSFWFTHDATAHTTMTMARYEDLAMHTEAVLERFLKDTGFQLKSATALQDAVDQYPANLTKLENDAFFNPSLQQDSTIQGWARQLLDSHGALLGALGYEDWLRSMAF